MAKPWHNYPPGFKARIFARDGGHCRILLPGICLHLTTPTPCTGCAQEIDHIIPPRIGGAYYTDENCRASCKPCNQARRRAHPHPTPSRTHPEHW